MYYNMRNVYSAFSAKTTKLAPSISSILIV